jgi:hypothetical protein
MVTVPAFVSGIPMSMSSVTIDTRASLVVGDFMLVESSFGDFRVMFVELNRTLSDGNAMLTRMSMMPAASEQRMQQHRRGRQNAGQIAGHRGFHRLGTRRRWHITPDSLIGTN